MSQPRIREFTLMQLDFSDRKNRRVVAPPHSVVNEVTTAQTLALRDFTDVGVEPQPMLSVNCRVSRRDTDSAGSILVLSADGNELALILAAKDESGWRQLRDFLGTDFDLPAPPLGIIVRLVVDIPPALDLELAMKSLFHLRPTGTASSSIHFGLPPQGLEKL